MPDLKPVEVALTSVNSSATVTVYSCQIGWDELTPTGIDGVRHCVCCSQNVYLVTDVEGFQRAVAQGRCVMAQGTDTENGAPARVVGKAQPAPYRLD